LYTARAHLINIHHFFIQPPAPTHIYTLSLHDALPISASDTATEFRRIATWFSTCAFCRIRITSRSSGTSQDGILRSQSTLSPSRDRKSTRLNSSHLVISYAVFCLKKKNHVYSV